MKPSLSTLLVSSFFFISIFNLSGLCLSVQERQEELQVEEDNKVKHDELREQVDNFIHFDDKNKNQNQVSKENNDRRFDEIVLRYHLVRYQPRHVHIAYSGEPGEMVITWSTLDNPNSTIVEYGRNRISENSENGTATYFEDHGRLHLSQYIHRVTLKNLAPGKRYTYHVGGDLGWSDVFFFVSKRLDSDTNWSPRLAVYGDLGNFNAQSLPRLQEEVQLGVYDAVLHVGDFAYDLDSNQGLVGDGFMEQIQSIAAYVPYMVCPGNHEFRQNFSHYKNRFTMPGDADSMYYSWDLGPIHFISISTEFYYFLQYGLKSVAKQYEWLENDLKEANKPENRKVRPWIIVYGHRPMYCSNNASGLVGDCASYNARTRVGIPYLNVFGLEDLLHEYGVDLGIWAHQHSYERMYPVYNYTVPENGPDPYTNPKALTHITTGSAGCTEDHATFRNEIPEWTAFRSSDYGYSRLHAVNHTHLHIEQVSDDQQGKVIDSFYLVRTEHEAYEIVKRKKSPPIVQLPINNEIVSSNILFNH